MEALAVRRPGTSSNPEEAKRGMRKGFVGETFAIILAGGRGSRLQQLTSWRAKPAVPFGGKFRIIDFPLSNCVNSGVRHIGIATQYKAQSLIRHVQRGWSFLDGRFGEFIELLPAQQRVNAGWYLGTVDAVYQNLDLLRQYSPRYVLVLAGDHVYKMDYREMLREHIENEAQMSVACVEVPLEQAPAFGVVATDSDSRVVGFEEKPAVPTPIPGRPETALASMGIYLFNASFLFEQVIRDAEDPESEHDFGRNVMPHLVHHGGRVCAHDFAHSCVNMARGIPYWRDVGTIDAYWEANMELARVVPDLNLYDDAWPIWTYQEQLPPAKFVFDEDGRRGTAVDSLVSGGCVLSGCAVRRSVLFSSVRIHDFSLIEDSVVLPNVEIGRDVVMKRAVVDKRCRIPDGMQIGVDPELDRKRFPVTHNGIALVYPEALGQRVHYLR